MYISIVLPVRFATPLDVLGSTPSAHDSISRGSIIMARGVSALRGRAGYAMGGGIAVAFVGAFVLGLLTRCMLRERRARQQARAHVQALAIQDREFWGVGGSSGQRIRRQEEDEEEGEAVAEETDAERRIRRRQERRAKEHGKFDSILERMERRALQEKDLKESKKTSDGGTTERISEKESSEGSSGSGSGNESDHSGVEKLAIPEPVYKGPGAGGGRMSLSNLRSSIS